MAKQVDLSTKAGIMAAFEAKQITFEQAMSAVEALKSRGPFTMKVGDKGTLVLRGVPGSSVKFGMSAYVEAFEFILAHADEIRAFIKANDSKLSRKNRDGAPDDAAARQAAALAKELAA